MVFGMLRLPELRAALAQKSTATVYRDVGRRLLPPPVKIGLRAVAWPADEIRAIVAARVRGDDDDAIRGLVERMVDERRRRAAALDIASDEQLGATPAEASRAV